MSVLTICKLLETSDRVSDVAAARTCNSLPPDVTLPTFKRHEDCSVRRSLKAGREATVAHDNFISP